MIFPSKVFNFNFYKKNITTPPELFDLYKGKSFLKRMLFHNLYEVNVGLGGTVFSENDVGGHV